MVLLIRVESALPDEHPVSYFAIPPAAVLAKCNMNSCPNMSGKQRFSLAL
jgi:hypothetical protein